jgi:hypothetical protein
MENINQNKGLILRVKDGAGNPWSGALPQVKTLPKG